ncbi:hypothetical protein [Thiomicrorhabdus arctica]|uniref:hypothetical protein n=1 Tax=Thiomicrorhabdus arctica TaxID=131540 RepID=UPI000366CE15|nr:hypothetical protein [Thiomicrorhabdus arctica]
MQEVITLYNQNRLEIEKLLIETIRTNGHIAQSGLPEIKQLFAIFPSLELIYIADQSYNQTSPNIKRSSIDESSIGKNRTYLISKVEARDENVAISTPYISSATGEPCVTLMYSIGDQYFFFDFNITILLTLFGVLERHSIFNRVTKYFYLAIGVSLMFFSLMSIGYAFYDYLSSQLLAPENYSLESVFKPIIALTMGLAIFDLAKTLLEREVFFKAYSDKKDESRLLLKFLTAIIIALSIEALMVVFKIALDDPSQMIYALYLIIGVSLIILSLSVYSKFVISEK